VRVAIKEPKPQSRIIWDSETLERMNVQVDGKFEAGFLRVPAERMRLRRYVELEKLAMLAICGQLPIVPVYEDIGKLSEVAYENVLLAIRLEERNHEHPGGKREKIDEEAFAQFTRHLDHPDSLAEFYGNLFEVLGKAQLEAYKRHRAESDEFFNRPTAKILEDAIATKRAQVKWGGDRYREMLGGLDEARRSAVRKRVRAFRSLLTWAGGVDGAFSGPRPAIELGAMEPIPENVNFDPAFKFDTGYMSREDTLYWRENRIKFDGVDENGEEITDRGYQLYSYCCEIDVFLQFAMIIYRASRDLPLGFYRDTTRQLWDEFRHTSMGHRVMRLNGIDPMDLIRPMRWTIWRQMSVAENYAWITQTGEACSLVGKHKQRKNFISDGRFHEQTLIEWDISDESQHVRYGARWFRAVLDDDEFEGSSKQFVINATEKFNWLYYQHMKRLDIIPKGLEEPKPYRGCVEYETLGA
jgi:hypothetical protein